MNAEQSHIDQIALEDFHNARRLVIGCPVYGRFYGSLNAWHVRRVLQQPEQQENLFRNPTVFKRYGRFATLRPQ